MSILFLLLKFLKVWETPYDYFEFLVLFGLDVNNVFLFYNTWKRRNK